MDTLKQDLPTAVACSCWLGVRDVAGVLILRDETLVAGDNRKGFFFGLVEERSDAAFKKLGVLILDYLAQRRTERRSQ